jgi:hypothetical protein
MGEIIPEAQVKGLEGLSFTAFTCKRNSAVVPAISSLKIMGANIEDIADVHFGIFH